MRATERGEKFAASKERTHVRTGQIAGGDAHFYRAAVQAPGDRATLVWNRRALGCIAPGCDTTSLTLSNLELEQLDPATGSTEARSASAIDNVEQVRSPSTGDVIYKVKAASTVDGLPGEPYAITARRTLTALAAPRPTTRVSLTDDTVRPGDDVRVVAEIINSSSDLSAESASTTLELAPEAELVSGPLTQALGTLAPNEVRFVTWTIRARSDAAAQIRVRTSATRYGETFASEDTGDLTADGTAPAVAIAAPAGRTTDAQLSVIWSGTDLGVGVRDYDVDVSIDDGPFAPWLAATGSTAASYPATAGSRYRFRARARDWLGNASGYAVSSEVAVIAPPTPPDIARPTPNPVRRSSPDLRVRSITRRGSRLEIRGTLARSAFRALSFDLRATANGRRLSRRSTAFPVAGRFKLALRVPRRLSGTLTVRYAGDDSFEPAAARARLRRL